MHPLAPAQLLTALATALPVLAQSPINNLNDAPIELEADSAEISHDKRTVIYNGNVIVTQAEQRLNGDTVTVSYSDENSIEHARITGNPALWRYQKTTETLHSGKAANIDYFVAENRLLLTGNAEVSTDRGVISGEQIEYNTVTGAAKALSGTVEDDRVRVIFRPDTNGGESQ